MPAQKILLPSERPISFHADYHREAGQPFGRCTFMVVMEEQALLTLNRTHLVRHATIRFNNAAAPHKRVEALAECLREAHDIATDVSKPTLVGRLLRAAFDNDRATIGLVALIVGVAIGYIIH